MYHTYLDALAFYGIESAHPGGFDLTSNIMMNERIDTNTTILDAGCGIGQTSHFLAETFKCHIYAVDNHPQMVKKAAQRFQQANLPIRVYMSSLEELPFPNDSFDYIVAESTTGFTEINKSIAEYYRVLKPGGILLSIDMTAEIALHANLKVELMNFYKLKNIPTELEWVRAFKEQGFKHTEILHSSTVLEELKRYSAANQRSSDSPVFKGTLNDIIKEHYRLMLTHGNSLGYRAFRVSKG
ncbi:class I SAM-dependent methyltransferase [Peribacillus sp. NPDC097224]|uniref:class I SAM-dependent methyltransferase n=1 Tax=Peribacillus sp. NPDC097224 TaxID=3364399 RepID=UPI00380702C2